MQGERDTRTTEKGRRPLKILLAAVILLAVVISCIPPLIRHVRQAAYPRTYEQLVEQYAEEYGIDSLAVYAIIRTESKFDPNALSNVGARGLMQITEETFAWIKLKIAPGEEISFDDLYDPAVNVRFGAYYLSRCLSRYGDLATAAAAYHSGWGTVDALLTDSKYAEDEHTLKEFPYQQMNLYVYKVTKAYDEYTALYAAGKDVQE